MSEEMVGIGEVGEEVNKSENVLLLVIVKYYLFIGDF